MSYDSCRKCGRLADEAYKAISHQCENSECPQKLQAETMRKFFDSIPVAKPRGFKQITQDRVELERALGM